MRWQTRWTRCSYTICFLIAFACGVTACSNKPSEKDCQALLDKMIDLEIAAAGTDKLNDEMKADLDKHRKQLRDYLSQSFMKRCTKDLPYAFVKCGLKAKSLDDYAACEKK